MVSLKDQLWIHDYDWESCNDRKCDKDQESDDDQKPHNKGQKCLGLLFNVKNQKWLTQ